MADAVQHKETECLKKPTLKGHSRDAGLTQTTSSALRVQHQTPVISPQNQPHGFHACADPRHHRSSVPKIGRVNVNRVPLGTASVMLSTAALEGTLSGMRTLAKGLLGKAPTGLNAIQTALD